MYLVEYVECDFHGGFANGNGQCARADMSELCLCYADEVLVAREYYLLPPWD